MKRVVPFVVLLMLLADSSSARSISSGTAQSGRLINGFEIPLMNQWIQFYGPVADRRTNFSTLEMAALLVRVARVVRNHAGGLRMGVGDCSVESGGDLARHASHNSGRDADILFYRTDQWGRPVIARDFESFNGKGRCRSKGCQTRFDAERNWWVVRTLVSSQRPAVQHIFVSSELRSFLLQHAVKRGEDPEILHRARRVLRQPSDSSVHSDHFHVRTFCSMGDREGGCRDSGVRWEWVPEVQTGGARTHGPIRARANERKNGH